MMAKILDGKIVRDKIQAKLSSQISELRTKPRLAIIQIGDLAESNTYIRQKVLFGEKIGAIVEHLKLDENTTQQTLNSHLSPLNSDASVHGIIIQLPIPKHLDKDLLINTIDPVKDVDGQTSINLKKLIENDPTGFTPATTRGVITLLDYYKIPVAQKHVVVVGRSSLVGKPTALSMLNKDATVTVCHSKTRKLEKITKLADILIVAAGKPKLITKNHVSKNQVVVDVGINVVGEPINTDLVGNRLSKMPENEPPGRKLIGDVDFDEVSKIVSAITPVPGGIGPLTVASLFQNLLEAYTHQT